MVLKENNRIRNLERTEFRCAQENYTACKGDCLTCPWHTKWRFWTEEDFDMERSMAMAADCNVEKEVLSSIMMEHMDNVSLVRFLIVSAVSSYYLSKFWRTTMQKKANGQTPAENPLSLLQGR